MQLNQIQLNHVYHFKNLYFIKKDERNYLLYDIKKHTSFEEVFDKEPFKKIAIIKFIFLDDTRKNKNSMIRVNNKTMYIRDKIQYITSSKDDNSSYYLEEFNLKIENEIKTFNLFVYKGEINNINCGLIKNKKNKCYEIIYLSKNEQNLPKELNIGGYYIKNFDKFSCTNRLRFNVMNIRKDNNFDKYNDNVSNCEIIYLINENNKITKYGIFDVNFEKKTERKYTFNINVFSKFLKDFNDKYDQKHINDINYNISYFKQEKKIYDKIFKDENLTKFRNLMYLDFFHYPEDTFNTTDSFIFFKNYCFFNLLEFVNKNPISDVVRKYFDLLSKISNYSNYNQIRILLAFIFLINEYKQIPLLININDLNNDHPYQLATKLQKDIISKLNEKSNISYPIIQFNSKMLEILPDNIIDYAIKKIFHIKNELAYTISLENLEKIKTHLTNLQEDFFFIFELQNDFSLYGLYIPHLRVMCINQFILCKNIFSYPDVNMAKNYAFSVNMVFSHERMCHGKETINNPRIPSIIYFNKNFERDVFNLHESFYNRNEGETGRIFETFIAEQILIKIMKDNFCFGNFLEYNYFIGDFHEIYNKAFEIFSQSYFYKAYKIIKIFICFVGIFFNFYIIYLINNIFEINITTNVLIYTLSLIFLILFSYKFYTNKKIINLNIFNYDANNNKKGKKEKIIYPDDYPVKPASLLGKFFDIFNFRNNKIRKILKPYTLKKYQKFDEKSE